MRISKVYFSYFSPIQATRKVAYNIAATLGAGLPNEQFNLTSVGEREKNHSIEHDELLIVALPSYGGRIPQVSPSLLRNLHGNHSPAIIVATYGNRGFDDVLVETQAILEEQGFHVVAASAFICVHAVAPQVGAGRPDVNDLAVARDFGKMVRKKLESVDHLPENLTLPGNSQLKPLMPPKNYAPETNDKCVLCMQCFRWCPVNAISYNNPNATDASKCILCQGCVIRCPVDARKVLDTGFNERAKLLEQEYSAQRLEPEIFI